MVIYGYSNQVQWGSIVLQQVSDLICLITEWIWTDPDSIATHSDPVCFLTVGASCCYLHCCPLFIRVCSGPLHFGSWLIILESWYKASFFFKCYILVLYSIFQIKCTCFTGCLQELVDCIQAPDSFNDGHLSELPGICWCHHHIGGGRKVLICGS